MKSVFVLLLLFLLLGLFVRKFNNRTRLLLICSIAVMLVYLYVGGG